MLSPLSHRSSSQRQNLWLSLFFLLVCVFISLICVVLPFSLFPCESILGVICLTLSIYNVLARLVIINMYEVSLKKETEMMLTTEKQAVRAPVAGCLPPVSAV